MNGLTELDGASKRRNASRHLRRAIQSDWTELVLRSYYHKVLFLTFHKFYFDFASLLINMINMDTVVFFRQNISHSFRPFN